MHHHRSFNRDTDTETKTEEMDRQRERQKQREIRTLATNAANGITFFQLSASSGTARSVATNSFSGGNDRSAYRTHTTSEKRTQRKEHRGTGRERGGERQADQK
jgi:hypothetical protein